MEGNQARNKVLIGFSLMQRFGICIPSSSGAPIIRFYASCHHIPALLLLSVLLFSFHRLCLHINPVSVWSRLFPVLSFLSLLFFRTISAFLYPCGLPSLSLHFFLFVWLAAFSASLSLRCSGAVWFSLLWLTSIARFLSALRVDRAVCLPPFDLLPKRSSNTAEKWVISEYHLLSSFITLVHFSVSLLCFLSTFHLCLLFLALSFFHVSLPFPFLFSSLFATILIYSVRCVLVFVQSPLWNSLKNIDPLRCFLSSTPSHPLSCISLAVADFVALVLTWCAYCRW